MRRPSRSVPVALVEEPIPPDVELDLTRYELRRHGVVERLEKLPMELLILLAERRGWDVSPPPNLEPLGGSKAVLGAEAGRNAEVRGCRRAAPGDTVRTPGSQTGVGEGGARR